MNRIVHVLAGMLLAAGAGACSDDSVTAPEVPTVPADSPPPAVDAGSPSVRTLVEAPVYRSPTSNLLNDPLFSLSPNDFGFGSFIAVSERGNAFVAYETAMDSQSPAGIGGAVAVVTGDPATDKKSDAVNVFASFLGGEGPFDVEVWVSKSNVAGAPVDLDLARGDVTATVMAETLGGTAYELAVDEDATLHTTSGRTWLKLRATITAPLPYGGMFVVRTGESGGRYHIAVPSVVARPLLDPNAVRTRSWVVAKTHALTTDERRLFARYRSIPTRLTPPAKAPRANEVSRRLAGARAPRR